MQPDQPTPASPEPAPQSTPAPVVPETVTSAPVVPTVGSDLVAYDSNPFRPLVQSLGRALTHNGIALLQLCVAFLLSYFVMLIAFVVGGLLSGVLHAPALLYIVILIAFIGLAWYYASLGGGIIELFAASETGRESTYNEFLAVGKSRAVGLVALGIITGLMIALGFVLLIIPGLILIGWFGLAPYVYMNEKLSIGASLRRSRELAKGHMVEVIASTFAGVITGNLLGSFGSIASVAGRYVQLKALKESGATPPPVHYLNWVVIFLAPIAIVGIILLAALSPKSSTTSTTTTQSGSYSITTQ